MPTRAASRLAPLPRSGTESISRRAAQAAMYDARGGPKAVAALGHRQCSSGRRPCSAHRAFTTGRPRPQFSMRKLKLEQALLQPVVGRVFYGIRKGFSADAAWLRILPPVVSV